MYPEERGHYLIYQRMLLITRGLRALPQAVSGEPPMADHHGAKEALDFLHSRFHLLQPIKTPLLFMPERENYSPQFIPPSEMEFLNQLMAVLPGHSYQLQIIILTSAS
jgi:hypothetical protein